VSGVERWAVRRGAGSRLGSRLGLPRLYLAGALSVLGGLLLWELASRFVVANALFLAAPSQIFAAIAALAKSGELWQHMSISASSSRSAT
jgi:ABC-type nitrate/sulfonate/bicarbonate transport system permease component